MKKEQYEKIVKEEGDYYEFEAFGLHCVLKRNSSWCGYVGVPKDSRLDGKSYSWDTTSENGLSKLEEAITNINVHGGLTYSGRLMGDVWYFGFDCSHFGDLNSYDLRFEIETENCVYRDKDYVIKETTRLAEQIKEIIELKL